MRLLSILLATLATGLVCLPGWASNPVRVSTTPDSGGVVLPGNILVFSNSSAAAGTELWRSDGTLAGTQLLVDLLPGPDSSFPGNFALHNGVGYFMASASASGGFALWRTDGTAGGTTKVTNLSGFPAGMESAGGMLLFNLITPGGIALWRSDGTSGGTFELRGGFALRAEDFAAAAGKVFFVADDGPRGLELWATDGTPAGTGLVKDINVGGDDGILTTLRAVNGAVVFGGFDGQGLSLWRSDGTGPGTQPVNSTALTGDFGPVVGNAVMFTVHDANGFGLWRSDGTAPGFYAIRGFQQEGAGRPQGYFEHQGQAYFAASAASNGPLMLFRTDGTPSGTAPLQVAVTGALDSIVGASGEEVFFLVRESASVLAIWGADRNLRVARKRFSITSAADDYYDFRSTPTGLYFWVTKANGSSAELWFAGAENPAGDDDNDGIPNAVEPGVSTNPLVKDNAIFTSASLFAMQQYRDFLGREGDAGGINFYSTRIANATMTRQQVIEAFLASPEFQSGLPQCTRLYFSFFNRIPDYGGLLFQVGQFRAGVPLEAIAQNFYNSPEFTNTYGALTNDEYINFVYQNVLGRAPDAGGFAYYKNLLDSNTITKGQMMIGFSESPEFQALIDNKVYVTAVYVGMLRRTPDAGGLSFYVNQIEGGAPRNSIINGFLGAPEYRSRFLP